MGGWVGWVRGGGRDAWEGGDARGRWEVCRRTREAIEHASDLTEQDAPERSGRAVLWLPGSLVGQLTTSDEEISGKRCRQRSHLIEPHATLIVKETQDARRLGHEEVILLTEAREL